MEKVILIDGNNILFRSYYATAYKGEILRNSKGFPTNALYGFINMINKIIKDESCENIVIAFDKGKTFRHEKYAQYKALRKETPSDLKEQFPLAKKLSLAMGIKYVEVDNYEADDIIGSYAKLIDNTANYKATIISSDKDLLQLISEKVEVKLLKSNDYILMNMKTFNDTYGLTPEKIVDLKALMGDASDNIPGVKGIGEKTALNLLHEYNSLENLYNNLDKISGKTKEKLELDKENAFYSKELATIYKDVVLPYTLEEIKYTNITDEYIEILKELEFTSLIRKIPPKIEKKEEKITILKDLKELNLTEKFAIYPVVNGNYHDKNLKGVAIYNKENSCYIPLKVLLTNKDIFNNDIEKCTYDLKKLLVSFAYLNINIKNVKDDLMISSYLLNYSTKDDIAYLMPDEIIANKNLSIEQLAKDSINKAKFIYENNDIYLKRLKDLELTNLYYDLELPLVYVLKDMELTGVNIDIDMLDKMEKEVLEKLNILTEEIYVLANTTFNISSPKQLGTILFDHLHIPYPRKTKNNNYSTNIDILNKLRQYPIIEKIINYRSLSKLYSSYLLGLKECIKEDGKIHTIFNQTLTRTGRLSSNSPNLQNIPIKEELGKSIRKAFVTSNNHIILSSDYSQIELRIFAHMSDAHNMIEAFNQDMDIHTKTAMDIYKVDFADVDKNMRRTAKAVNFGILYGISSFGLSEDLGINMKEAKEFIDNYLTSYPGINNYMKEIVVKAYKDGYVKTLFNRIRYLEELKSDNYMVRSSGERMALNTPIQGTSADILKKAMIEIYNEFNRLNLKSKMIIQVHDELVFDVLEEEKDIVIKIIKDIMENVFTLKVPLKVEISMGKNWYEAK